MVQTAWKQYLKASWMVPVYVYVVYIAVLCDCYDIPVHISQEKEDMAKLQTYITNLEAWYDNLEKLRVHIGAKAEEAKAANQD